MTEPEIAAALGISLGTVKSTVSRAVARLRIDAELGEGATGLATYPHLSLLCALSAACRGLLRAA
jgi:DNA-binding NarL/FixJ family response regulator